MSKGSNNNSKKIKKKRVDNKNWSDTIRKLNKSAKQVLRNEKDSSGYVSLTKKIELWKQNSENDKYLLIWKNETETKQRK